MRTRERNLGTKTAVTPVEPLINVRNLTKTFQTTGGAFMALKGVTLGIHGGQMVALTGKSGSGKSTLLNIIAGIDRATEGGVSVAGVNLNGLSEGELAAWRGKNIGVVFQFFQLLPTLTVLENVMLPMDFCRTYLKEQRKPRALSLLEQVGIAEQAGKFPSALSGGQQQRAAIARALANDPPVIVADEPTGNLDSQTATAIFDLFGQLSRSGKTIVIVTHEREFTKYFQSTVSIADGAIVAAAGVQAA